MVHRHRVSTHLVLIGLLALGGLLAGTGTAAAQSAARLYTVEGVLVDVTAGSAVAAREQAYAEGQRAAFRMLLEKLTPETVHGRLPAAPSGAALDSLVQGFEVRDERASGVRYIAKMVVRFNPAEIQALLARADLPSVTTPSQPVLVLPLWQSPDSGMLLWEDPNPWREAWERASLGQSLVPVLVPLADTADLVGLSAEQAEAGDRERLSAMARRYGAVASLVAIASPAESGGQQALDIRFTRYDAAGEPETRSERVTAASGETGSEMFARAVRQVSSRLDEAWKNATAVRPGLENRLAVITAISGLEEWTALRRKLAEIGMIRRQDLVALSRGEAEIVLWYAGQPEQLRVALAQRGLSLASDPLAAGGSVWRLSAQ
ncbi:DUF2066 domain-containing protein [Oceanibaculum indicum]|uniref:Uncharacterized protein DUF2066 n=1 Tax=Oceanibaculum indicum TaxID=526216 RepID=A0A420WP50_9PROT|nr:DUF2066 domain-containing protein [Oceanibaculum indicum]RKQ72818.1 uncharacterized protein DUF2066 [Oceanibaculum indicum]